MCSLVKKNQYPTGICIYNYTNENEMDLMVRNEIACNCILIDGIAFRYAHIKLNCFFDDFNCIFMQIHSLSRLLLKYHDIQLCRAYR